jgi:hypothetical protein
VLPGIVKLTIKTLISDNSSDLVSGMTRGSDDLEITSITTSRITQWAQSGFGFVVDVGEVREWFDRPRAGTGAMSRATVVANAPKHAEYDVDIRIAGQSFQESDEGRGETIELHETATRQFDLLLARTVQLFRDNPEFQSADPVFTIGVKQDEQRDQAIRVRNWSGVYEGRAGAKKPQLFASITFTAETCGEPASS